MHGLTSTAQVLLWRHLRRRCRYAVHGTAGGQGSAFVVAAATDAGVAVHCQSWCACIKCVMVHMTCHTCNRPVCILEQHHKAAQTVQVHAYISVYVCQLVCCR